MTSAVRPPHRFARPLEIGWDGLATLALSNLALLATFGLSGAWMLHRVWRIARDTPCQISGVDWVVVLGRRLRHDQITGDYACRLRRAAALHQADPQRRILLVGGRTGSSVSEAECGRRYLLDFGLPESGLQTEDQSLHTLDNLRHARQWLGQDKNRPFALVTSRYHLARSQTLARGLSLQPLLCAAEDAFRIDLPMLGRLVLEAYYLHWYEVGRHWSRWTGNRHSIARIT